MSQGMSPNFYGGAFVSFRVNSKWGVEEGAGVKMSWNKAVDSINKYVCPFYLYCHA